MDALVELLRTDNVLIQRMTAQSLTEKMGEDARNRDLVAAANGVEALVDICVAAADTHTGDDDLTLHSLEALRQLIRDHPANKERLGEAGGVELSLRFVGSSKMGLQEASLALLLSLAVDCEVNCRRILKTGLDLLIHAAEAKPSGGGGGTSSSAGAAGSSTKRERAAAAKQGGGESSSEGASAGGGGGTNGRLAQELLQLLGPYSWIECTNCNQLNPGGSVCAQCGHPIEFSY
jgi:hypothetical protein